MKKEATQINIWLALSWFRRQPPLVGSWRCYLTTTPTTTVIGFSWWSIDCLDRVRNCFIIIIIIVHSNDNHHYRRSLSSVVNCSAKTDELRFSRNNDSSSLQSWSWFFRVFPKAVKLTQIIECVAHYSHSNPFISATIDTMKMTVTIIKVGASTLNYYRSLKSFNWTQWENLHNFSK